MVGSLATYNFYTSTVPLRLIDSYTFSGSGSFFKTAIAPNGEHLRCSGYRRYYCIRRAWRMRAQPFLSGEVIPPWKPATAYSLNTLVTAPSESHVRHQIVLSVFDCRNLWGF